MKAESCAIGEILPFFSCSFEIGIEKRYRKPHIQDCELDVVCKRLNLHNFLFFFWGENWRYHRKNEVFLKCCRPEQFKCFQSKRFGSAKDF